MLGEKALIRGRKVNHQDLPSLRHWFPVVLGHDPASVWWRSAGSARFTKPFFQDTLTAQAPHERLVCQAPLAALDDVPESVPPTAFIFHVSRCGSTLLTQTLATLPQCIVMSEPPVLDAFFRLHHQHPGQSGGEHTLRQLVAALGQRRFPGERYFFVKFDSWHLPWAPFLRRVFPRTPFLFLYRHPGEVLASHRRQRGPQMVPDLLDMTLLQSRLQHRGGADGVPGDLDGHAIRVIEAILGSAVETAASADLMLLDYKQLPEVIWRELFAVFSLKCTEGQLDAVRARAGFHSKHAGARFDGDPVGDSGEHARTPDRLEEAMRCYEHLEQLRRRQVMSRAQQQVAP